jgi:hypothetical protein
MSVKISLNALVMMKALTKAMVGGKRPSEAAVLIPVIQKGEVTISEVSHVLREAGLDGVDGDAWLETALRTINGDFFREPRALLIVDKKKIIPSPAFRHELADEEFKRFALDLAEYSLNKFHQSFSPAKWRGGFVLYRKYTRADVCRILNWEFDEQATVFGYRVKDGACPIFVNYHKEADISDTTRYDDQFVDESVFSWMSRSRRTMLSGEVAEIINQPNTGLRILLFIKKSNDEGSDFYYMGDVDPVEGSARDTTIPNGDGPGVPIVNIRFKLHDHVESALFDYLTARGEAV